MSYETLFSGTGGGLTSAEYSIAPAGRHHFQASGTFAGGNVKLQVRPAGHATYFDIAGATLSANGTIGIDCAFNDNIRAVRSGAIDIVATLSYAGGA
jgi:hypothetical protein